MDDDPRSPPIEVLVPASPAVLPRAGVEPSLAAAALLAAVPPCPSRIEPRRRLVRRLLATADMKAVILSAPAGYGKTALLQAWTEAEPRAVRWVTLDRHRGSATRAGRELVRAIAALRRETRPSVLVVDDADAAGGTLADMALEAAELDLPASVTLVLSSRCAPPGAFGRLRSAWPVLELDAEDLALTRGEAAELLGGAGLHLEAEEVDTLVARTEGWACGLRLASIAVAAQGDAAQAVARFGGDDRVVADYLRGELLAELSADQLAFLTDSSILAALAGPICDAVLERHDSAHVLFELGRSTAPLRPTDRSEEHFRLHPLVTEMLHAELRRDRPDDDRRLHRRASAFHEERGDLEAAIDHAVAGGLLDRAAGLVWRLAPSELFSGRRARLEATLARVGEAQVLQRPALALTAALCALARGEHEEADRWAEAARGELAQLPGPWVAPLAGAAALLRAATGADDAAELEERAAAALALAPDGSPWRPVCCLMLGVANAVAGDLAAARDHLAEGARRGALGAPGIEALCLAQLGLIALLDSDVEGGSTLAERARSRIEAHGLDDAPTRAFVLAVAAFARAYRGRVVEARGDAAEAQRLLDELDDFAPWYDAEARIALARAQLRLSDVAAARDLTAQAAKVAGRMADGGQVRTWIDDAWSRADTFAADALAGPSSLTAAELRVLRFLPSHLSFRELADRLYVSANTVKTQAHAVYRKLDASSRSEAVARARSLGLIDA